MLRADRDGLAGVQETALLVAGAGRPAGGAKIEEGQRPVGSPAVQTRVILRRLPERRLDLRQRRDSRRRPFPRLNPEGGTHPVGAGGKLRADALAPLRRLHGRRGGRLSVPAFHLVIRQPDLRPDGADHTLDARRISGGRPQEGPGRLPGALRIAPREDGLGIPQESVDLLLCRGRAAAGQVEERWCFLERPGARCERGRKEKHPRG